jgi:hypothetical protein
MIRPYAVIFGLALLVIGILAFIPQLVTSGHLFNIFRFNFEYRMGLCASGILGILCGLYSREAAKVYFIVLGGFYGLLAILGVIQGEGMLLGLFTTNSANVWFNGILAALSLYIGYKKQ